MSIRRAIATTVALMLIAGGCSAADGGDAASDAAAACPSEGGDNAAKTILRCTEGSVGFVETEVATGTGVVIELDDERYLLTNAHVVDPFGAADVTLGTTSLEAIPVVGIDASADLALLGPLADADLPAPLDIADGTDLERGDEVYLVGFPGESAAADLEATIASGIVSRVRQVKEFEQRFIQTDASIGGGQSGGPLFDVDGRLVGISGLGFAENFALALTGADVRRVAAEILDGKGDDYLALPTSADEGDTATSGTLRISDAGDGQVLYLPPASSARTWELTVDVSGGAALIVQGLVNGETVAASSNARSQIEAAEADLAAALGRAPDDQVAIDLDARLSEHEARPGTLALPVSADEALIGLVIAPLADAPLEVAWSSNLPVAVASRAVTEEPMAVGDTVDRLFSSFDTAIDLLVDLDTGQEVLLHVRSAVGDVGMIVFPPSMTLDHVTASDPEGAGAEVFEDTGDGLYGLDARARYEAAESGLHRIRLYSNELISVRLRFSVEDCADVDCDAKGTTRSDGDS